MDATDIVPLNETVLRDMLRGREECQSHDEHEKRESPRWPFQGTVELWFGDPDAGGHYALATCENLSVGGVGVRFDEPIEPGTELSIAIHEPEKSLHGKAVVRHCTRLRSDYYIGLEFMF